MSNGYRTAFAGSFASGVVMAPTPTDHDKAEIDCEAAKKAERAPAEPTLGRTETKSRVSGKAKSH